MANQCNVIVLEEVSATRDDDWALCYQWCRYVYADKSREFGYRFIWRMPGSGNLQAARGQARLPSADLIRALLNRADEGGWGDKKADDADRY